MNTPTANPLYESPPTGSAAQIDPVKLQNLVQELKDKQNLPLGFTGGLVMAGVAAIIWAVVTALADFQIGWMAVGVGFVVGLAVRQFGQGIDKVFGFTGGALSLLGCLAGNLLTVAIVISRQEGAAIQDVMFLFLSSPALVLKAMQVTFSPIDLLFYAIAVYEGYKFSIRRITRADLAKL